MTGEALLLAFVVGVEIECRIGDDMQHLRAAKGPGDVFRENHEYRLRDAWLCRDPEGPPRA